MSAVIMVSQPPMTPAMRERLFFVGDDEVFRVEVALDAIQRAKLLAFACAAEMMPPSSLSRSKACVGCPMASVTVVGCVDGVGDWFLFEQAEALGDDAVRWLNLHIAQDAGGEASAEFGFFDGHRVVGAAGCGAGSTSFERL